MTPNPFTRRGLREDKKRWRIGLPGACGLCTCSRSGVTLMSWDQEFSTDLGAGPQAARKAEQKHHGIAQDGRGRRGMASAGLICAKLLSTHDWSGFGERIVRRREFIALLGSATAIRALGARAERPLERILYFTYSAGYRHDVIPLSKAILTQLGRNSGVFEVTV